MKKTIALSFCFTILSITASGQADTAFIVKKFFLDSTTSRGEPVGDPETKEISKDGGTIISSDGRLELIFPEGALKKKKKITIQPVTNHVANGRGNAYRMEPSGLQFDKPVSLIFHYSEDEMAGTLPELKGIASQDKNGKWEALQEIETDTTARTITSQIFHFSSYSTFDKIVLRPSNARVKVEKNLPMEIHFTVSDPHNEIFLPVKIPAPQWSVNTIPLGNPDVGRISVRSSDNAIYTAPVSVPDENPVAVSAKLKGMEFTFRKKKFKDLTLTSNLLIYDRAYTITMNLWMDNSADGPCTLRMEDGGAFTVVMEGTHTTIKEIANRDMTIRINPCYNCPMTWANKAVSKKGPINIFGTKKIIVTPASLPGTPFSRVQLFLNHIAPPLPVFKTACPAGGGMPSFSMPVFLPPLIEFEANNKEEQIITLTELSNNSIKNSSRSGIKIVIKLIHDDN